MQREVNSILINCKAIRSDTMRQKIAFLKVALVVVLIGAMGILPGCMKKEPVKIGFVADLTGK